MEDLPVRAVESSLHGVQHLEEPLTLEESAYRELRRVITDGMLRVREGGRALWLELWELDAAGLVQILDGEPPGLTVGRVLLADERSVLGVLAEPFAVEAQLEITAFGGWRAYRASWAQT